MPITEQEYKHIDDINRFFSVKETQLAQFHNENKLFLLSRAPQMKRILGRMIATRFDEGAHPEIIALEYMTKAQKALSLATKKGRIAHTMERVFGKFSNQLSKKEAVDAIELYMLTEGGMAELGQLCRKWGIEEAKIEELGLNVLGSVGGYTAGNG